MDESYARVRTRLEDLTDEEFFWEPAPGCWRVFFDDASGRWSYDYEEPDPDPPPFTTIGWRLVHIALCKVMYHEWAYGPKELTWLTIETPHTAADAISTLQEGQALLVSDLEALRDDQLDALVLTNWGESWPAWRIFWTMVDHDSHHGAELGLLRDLYRTAGPGAGPKKDPG